MTPFVSGFLLFSSIFAADVRPEVQTTAVYEVECSDMGFDSEDACADWCAHFDTEDEAGTCEADGALARVGFFHNRTARAFLRWYADIDVVKVGPAPRS